MGVRCQNAMEGKDTAKASCRQPLKKNYPCSAHFLTHQEANVTTHVDGAYQIPGSEGSEGVRGGAIKTVGQQHPGKSGRGQPHSTTLRAFRESRISPTGRGVRLPSAAFGRRTHSDRQF